MVCTSCTKKTLRIKLKNLYTALYPFGTAAGTVKPCDLGGFYMGKKNAMSTKMLVMYALLTAIVVVLQLMGSFVRFGVFSVSLVLVPIVIGAALCGMKAGAWLGFVFGCAVLLSGDAGAFLAVNVPGTIATVLVKGTLAGLVAGLVYKALEHKNLYVAVIAAAIVCPVVNTGIFLVGCKLFFMEIITTWAGGADVATYIITVLVGGNFLFELGANAILSPAIVRILKIFNM